MYFTVFFLILRWLNVTDTVIPLLYDIIYDKKWWFNQTIWSINCCNYVLSSIEYTDIAIRKSEMQAKVLALWRILFIINFYRFSLINFFSAFIRFINEREHKSCYRNVVIKTIVDTQGDSISLPVYLATKIFEKRYKVLNSSMISTIEKSSAMLGVQCHYIWPHCWRAINVHVTGSLHRICNRIRADRNLITLR